MGAPSVDPYAGLAPLQTKPGRVIDVNGPTGFGARQIIQFGWFLPAELAARIQPFLPGAAGTMISEIVGVGDAQAWGNFAVFVGYALITSLIAAVVLDRRDA